MKKLSLFLCAAIALLTVACTSPKDAFVESLSEFCEQVKNEHHNYSMNDLQIAAEQYLAFREEASLYSSEFTAQDNAIIEECYRSLNKIIVSGYIHTGVDVVGGYLQEALKLIEDLSDESISNFLNGFTTEE